MDETTETTTEGQGGINWLGLSLNDYLANKDGCRVAAALLDDRVRVALEAMLVADALRVHASDSVFTVVLANFRSE